MASAVRKMGVSNVLAVLALLSLLLALWQWLIAIRFPLHRRIQDTSFAPPVTLLKPLKGFDDNTLTCLASWLTQDYPGPVQILFGVASMEDEVCELVKKLIAQFPQADAQLVVCHEALGVNAKVSSLIQLSRYAENEIIVVSDADVLVPRDFLLNVVEPLREPEVGLVNCFYRLANPSTTAMRWEAVAINVDFWSQVLQGQSLAPLDFALGAVMATHRDHLDQIGGFESLADHLADDYHLGNRIARAGGKRIALCPVVVDCLSEPMTWGEVWTHQLRWSRTIRVCKPGPYAASIVSNATLWPLLWAMAHPTREAITFLGVCLVFRIFSALTLQARFGKIAGQIKYWWIVPVKDLLQAGLWAKAFSGNHIIWRGQRFYIQSDGRLIQSDGRLITT
jgi:ceramide glucosyltransferase